MHYILNQDNKSLLEQFFQTHIDFPVKSDWISEMKEIISDLDMAKSFGEVKKMKKNHYESFVNKKIKAEAVRYLVNKVKTKGSLVNYENSLEMQNYLKPNAVLTFQEEVNIFSYRSEMNEISLKYIHGNKLCICKQEKILNIMEKNIKHYKERLPRQPEPTVT